ncbi:hypothetical protein [Sphingomonas sp. RB1R13]|uniref:hypothetical protein n=1 Tax=Sphingomonas sp. RB1R13 TaxID=3096159 RepID=UPI002FC66097
MLDESDLRLIEAHHGIRRLDAITLTDFNPDQTMAADHAASFDLDMMWHRGRFARSLLAPSGPASDVWRAENTDELLPLRPDLPKHSPLASDPWQWFALQNGREETAIFQQSRLRRDAFDRLRQTGEQRDVIFRLAPWSPPVNHRLGQALSTSRIQGSCIISSVFRRPSSATGIGGRCGIETRCGIAGAI